MTGCELETGSDPDKVSEEVDAAGRIFGNELFEKVEDASVVIGL